MGSSGGAGVSVNDLLSYSFMPSTPASKLPLFAQALLLVSPRDQGPSTLSPSQAPVQAIAQGSVAPGSRRGQQTGGPFPPSGRNQALRAAGLLSNSRTSGVAPLPGR